MITKYDADRDGPFFGTLDFRTITNEAHCVLAGRIRHAAKRVKVGPIVTLHIEDDGRFAVWTRHPKRHFDVHYTGSIRDGVLRFNGEVIENA